METTKPITVFWSWQSDSPKKENQNFIQKCIEAATSSLSKTTPWILKVDRDTKGVAGTPAIAETILAKIVSSDIFIWDATLTYEHPKPAPNPNVLFELGYALAILGEGRIIGVMNTANGQQPADLPFDLVHRRWPILYSLPIPPTDEEELATYAESKKEVRKTLVDTLKTAIELALAAPKTGAVKNDIDLKTAQRFWQTMNSIWVHNWYEDRGAHPMYEDDEYLNVFEKYTWDSKRPENQFQNLILKDLHQNLVTSIRSYCMDTAREMGPMEGNSKRYILSCKVRWLSGEEYDKEYDRQKEIVWSSLEKVWQAWQTYINELNARYPEIIEIKKQ